MGRGDMGSMVIGGIIAVVVGVIGIQIISGVVVDTGGEVFGLNSTQSGKLTGLTQVGVLLPLALVGALIAFGVKQYRGRG